MNEAMVRTGSGLGTMACLLQVVDTTGMPKGDDVVQLVVGTNPKTRQLGLMPEYLDQDPHAYGYKSMRFYQAINPKALKLVVGQQHTGRIVSVFRTKLANKFGAMILKVKVEITA